MANPHRGAVALEAGDQVLSLRFTTNSICELEEHFGKPVSRIIEEMQDEKNVGMKMVRALVWAALLDAHPDMTPARAGSVLDVVGTAPMMEKIGLAMQRFFPEADGEGKDEPNPRKAKAG